MNAQEYKLYQERLAAFIRKEDIRTISQNQDEAGESESYFSWRACDCCGSYLGGDRYDMIAIVGDEPDNLTQYQVCCDCLYFLEYGQLDDMTMLKMKEF